MKLAARTFRLQWELHAWSGVAASLLLFVIFFCGVFALFRDELEIWQDPALHVPFERAAREAAPPFDAVLARVEQATTIPRGASLGISVHETTRFASVWIYEPDTERERALFVDTQSGAVVPERSRLGNELYQMHFFYRVPWGLELSGVLAVALLVALVSGLLIHWKDLRRQFWQFRPGLRLRFASSDAHKVLSVFGLPFSLMFGWSGAVICLFALLGQALVQTNFDGDTTRPIALRGYLAPERALAGRAAPMRPLSELVATARAALEASDAPSYASVRLYGDANAWASVWFESEGFEQQRYAALDAVSGRLLAASSAAPSTPAQSFERVLFDLHFATYGGLLLKALYALLALAACAAIITGNLVWLDRRDAGRAHAGNRLLERVTAGVAGGLAFGVAFYFAANRALPWDVGRRADLEFAAFLVAWALGALAALVPRWPARAAAAALCGLASVLLLCVVVADVATVDANLITALPRGLPAVFACEVLLLALALGNGGMALALSRRPARIPDRAPRSAEPDADTPATGMESPVSDPAG